MWIDTHCHLDAHEFGGESAAQAALAKAQGVDMIVLPAVEVANFSIVAQLAASVDNACYALGIHPIYVPHAEEDHLRVLREQVAAAMADPRFVALGEIGLDFFIPMLTEPAMREKQISSSASS
jgi:TatD DNase family protein